MNCSPNIITANFSGGRHKAKTAWRHQWDHGQVLCVTGIEDLPLTFTAHFSVHKEYGAAQPVEGIDGRVEIPDIWLTFGKQVYCWIYLTDGESGETVYTITIPVIPRPMPEYYEMEDTGVFDGVVAEVSGYAESADGAATRAATSATAATQSASAAAASEESASESADRAEYAMQQAVSAQNEATAQATIATEKASQASGYATAAGQSATSAEQSKTSAANAAMAAGQAASAAGNSATTASTKAGEADQSATDAAESATVAAGSATAASGSAATAAARAAEAANSAGQAATARDAAAAAQGAAETAASGASQSATAAAGSATAAAGSATAAAGSATTASTKADEAAASAAAAAASAASLTVDSALSDSSTNPVQNKVITGELTDVKSAIAPIVPVRSKIVFVPGYYIRTGNIGDVGSIIDLTPVQSSAQSYAIISCVPGDVFELTALGGGNAARSWCFATAENALISNSASGTISATLTAPDTAAKIILNNNNADGVAYKVTGTAGFSALQAGVAEIDSIIDDITSPSRNLWDADATVSFTKSKTVTLPTPIPAGTYTLSAVVTSSDTDKTVSRFQINSSSVTKDLTRDTRASGTFTTTDPIASITFYASQNSTTSTGDTATWTDIQLEAGRVMTPYVPHKLTTVDDLARDMIYKMVKYVSTSGSDANDGNSASSAYATFAKAIAEGADTIYIAHGTYNEGSIPENQSYRNRGVRIIADGATIVMSGTNGFGFRLANVDISGLTIDVTNASSASSYGILLLNCTGRMTDCTVIGAKGAGGYRLDGSKMTLTRCVVANCAVDGFNGHTVNTGYETEVTLIDCIAHDCGDDGASIHEAGKMYVYGGEYYNNVQTGLAPHNQTVFEAFDVHCHHNGKGIEAIEDTLAEGATPAVGRVIGCILNDNTSYGLDVKNYTVNALTNGYANNGTAPTRTQTGGTINSFTVI